jgi:hypothetical protein
MPAMDTTQTTITVSRIDRALTAGDRTRSDRRDDGNDFGAGDVIRVPPSVIGRPGAPG